MTPTATPRELLDVDVVVLQLVEHLPQLRNRHPRHVEIDWGPNADPTFDHKCLKRDGEIGHFLARVQVVIVGVAFALNHVDDTVPVDGDEERRVGARGAESGIASSLSEHQLKVIDCDALSRALHAAASASYRSAWTPSDEGE